MSASTAITRVGGGWSIAPANMGELFTFAQTLAESDLAPKDYRNKPGNCVIAIQLGGELGLSPMQAIQNIAVINGRPTVWGDAMIALCMQHPDYVDTVESYDPATRTAMCVAKRHGRSDKIATFSWEDAVAAKLDKKDTYQQYPKRMLQMRARGFALRDQWTDVLKGLISAEEAQDYPKEVRAEVVSQKTVVEPPVGINSVTTEQKQERKSTPPPTAAKGPVFLKNWPNKTWAGMPLAAAPANVIGEYIEALEAMLKDEGRKRFWPAVQKAMDEAATTYDALVAAEMDKNVLPPAEVDPITEKLQQAIDARQPEANESKSDGWGLEAPQ